MVCPKCGSENVNVQAVAEQKGRGCFGAIMWILLACCTFGIILLIPLLTRKRIKAKNMQFVKVAVTSGKFKQKSGFAALFFVYAE